MKNTHKTAIIDQYKQNTIAVLYSNVDNVGGSDYGKNTNWSGKIKDRGGCAEAFRTSERNAGRL